MSSTSMRPGERCGWGWEQRVDLAFGPALAGAAGDVGDGGLVAAHAHHDRAEHGRVGLPVAATVAAVAGGFAR